MAATSNEQEDAITRLTGIELVDSFLGISVFLMVVAVFVPGERLAPFHDRPIFRRNWYHDLSFWFLNRPMVIAGGAAMLAVALFLSEHVVPEAITTRISELPLWTGVPLAILVADLTFYTVHRACHTFPVLWQFHAIHHSIRELDWLAAVRVHPVDQLITSVSGFCLQLALGFSPATLAVTGTIYLWQSHTIHSNVRLPLGPLAWIFVGPTFHHWHHSTGAAARDRNFAGQLAFIDWLFGTAYYPVDRLPAEYGTDDPAPDSYAASLVYPVKRLKGMADGTLQTTGVSEAVSTERR